MQQLENSIFLPVTNTLSQMFLQYIHSLAIYPQQKRTIKVVELL